MQTLATSLASKEGCTMCFSEPGRVTSFEGSSARVVTGEGIQDVSLRIVEAAGERVGVGDWVLVALGLVVEVLEEADAKVLFDEMAAIRRSFEP